MKSKIAMTLAVTLALQSTFGLAAGTCPAPVSVLADAQSSPCYGFLFSPDKASEVTKMSQDFELVKQKLDLTIQQMTLYKESLEATNIILKAEQDKSGIWQASAEKYSQLYTEQQDSRSNRDIICVVLGIVLTIASGFALGQASKASK